jgi:hypothetical protein
MLLGAMHLTEGLHTSQTAPCISHVERGQAWATSLALRCQAFWCALLLAFGISALILTLWHAALLLALGRHICISAGARVLAALVSFLAGFLLEVAVHEVSGIQ